MSSAPDRDTRIPEGEGSSKAYVDAALRDLRAKGFPPGEVLAFISRAIRSQMKAVRTPPARLRALYRALFIVFGSLSLLFVAAEPYLSAAAAVGTAIALASWFLLFGALAYVSLPFVRTPAKKPLQSYPLPNVLTLWRLASVPLILSAIVNAAALRPIGIYVVAFFAAIATSDLLDGLLARATGTETDWGRAVDPLADVLVQLAVVVALAAAGYVPWWFVTAVLIRYTMPAIGALALLFLRGPFKILPTLFGKVSGFAVAFTSGWVLLREIVGPGWTRDPMVNYWVLLLSTLLCLATIANHISVGIEELRRDRTEERGGGV